MPGGQSSSMSTVNDGLQWAHERMLVLASTVGGFWSSPSIGASACHTRRAVLPPYQPKRKASAVNVLALVVAKMVTVSPLRALSWSHHAWSMSTNGRSIFTAKSLVPGRAFSAAMNPAVRRAAHGSRMAPGAGSGRPPARTAPAPPLSSSSRPMPTRAPRPAAATIPSSRVRRRMYRRGAGRATVGGSSAPLGVVEPWLGAGRIWPALPYSSS